MTHSVDAQGTVTMPNISPEAHIQACTGTSFRKDTVCKDIFVVRIVQLGSKHCVLTAMVALSKDNSV